MNWLNIEVSTAGLPEVTGSDHAEVGIWFRLLCYCASHENGGKIRNSRKWTDRQWMIACGVTVAEVSSECRLWSWSATCLTVNLYPAGKEKEVAAKRAAGKATAHARWKRKTTIIDRPISRLNGHPKNSSATSSADSSATSSADSCEDAEGKWKGMEGNG